jgi:hypothetical protein
MNPTESPGFEKTRQIPYRQVFCVHYSDCLEKAVKQRWSGFSCYECYDYEIDTGEPTAWLHDALRCAALLKRAEFSVSCLALPAEEI